MTAKLKAAYTPGATPAAFSAAVLKEYMNSVNDKANQIEKEIKKAKNNKDQVKKLSKQLAPVKKLANTLTTYFELIPKLQGRNIPVEIYLDGKSHRILVARTPK